jgi:2'-deoxynucleoside 5'-phosphate N-hydrolase
MRIFFAGPLTVLENPELTKDFYIKLANVAKEAGHETFLAFLNGTDPVKNPEVSPTAVYQIDIKELENSDLMVAYVGESSTGTGIEVEHAKEIGVPVVLLFEEDKKVSRMLRGSPIIKKEIVFTTVEDCLTQFRDFLDEFVKLV